MTIDFEIFRGIFVKLLMGFNNLIIYYFVCTNTIYLVLLATSAFTFVHYAHRRHAEDLSPIMNSHFIPPISIIVPAHNEYNTIIQTVKSLLMLRYPQTEIIIVNDGSSDDTLGILKRVFALQRVNKVFKKDIETKQVRDIYLSRRHANLVVVNKENGGKADALNAGLNVAMYPLFCSIDADSILDDDSLIRAVLPFLEDPRSTVAVGGSVRLANGSEVVAGRIKEVKFPTNAYAAFQNVEYLRSFLCARVGWDMIGSLLIISGAFGVFDKATVISAGGFMTSTVGEDMELIVRIHRKQREAGRKYRVRFVPDPVCWTEGPENYTTLSNQRTRWQRGVVESLWRNKKMFMNPKYGVVGLLGVPYFMLFEMLGALIEIPGYLSVVISYFFGVLSLEFFLSFLIIAFGFGSILTLSAAVMEELSFRKFSSLKDLIRLLLHSLLEHFGYRQVEAWWRFKGIMQKFWGVRSWGRMERKGFAR